MIVLLMLVVLVVPSGGFFENGMPLKWQLVSPGLACFHGNLDEVNELLLLINCVCVSTNNNYLCKP